MSTGLTVRKVEDYEGQGECSACGRRGLRWVVTISDGSRVGSECTKAILGWKVSTRGLKDWVPLYRVAAEHTDHGSHYVLWQSIAGNNTRETQNGSLTMVGGVRESWVKRGWLAQ